MRNRINKNLVATTSDSKSKKRYVERNFSNNRPVIYIMNVFGTRKKITRDEYYRLLKAGCNVEMTN